MIRRTMNTEKYLSEYGLSRDTAARYVDAITRLNQTETADELDVSRDTVHRYKNAFNQMPDEKRALLITILLQDQRLDTHE